MNRRKSKRPSNLPGLVTVIFAATIAPNCAFAQQADKTASSDQTIVLFDGSNLDQWRGYQNEAIGAGWKIDDGILKFDGSGGGDIITRASFTNFELNFEWAVTEGANSGVMYKVGLGDSAPYMTGPEYQILDNDRHADGKSKLTSAAALYGLYAAESGKTSPVGQWNTARIVINGNHVEHWLNDVKVVDAGFGSADWQDRLGKSKFHDWEKFATLATGHIALQDHGDEVWFRNISIRNLTPDSGDGK